MNTTVHPAEAINPQAAVSELKSAGASSAAPISEFEQSMDDMLYAAYADGRADERGEIAKMVATWDALLERLPVFAWASVTRPEVIHHAVKDLWLKVSPQRVENYIEPLVLLEDVRAAIAKATGAQQ